MKSISAWFDHHMKTRIALQLVLDGLPLFLLAYPLVLGGLELDERVSPGWWDYLGVGCMYFMMFGGGTLLFVLSIWLRSRARVEFECYPWCKGVSVILRLLSVIPAILSLGFLVGIAVLFFRSI